MLIPETLPSNTDHGIPLIAVYYICSMIFILFATFATILTYIIKPGMNPKSSIFPFNKLSKKKTTIIDLQEIYK